MNRLEALVSLNLILDIGSIRLKKLLEFFNKPEDILKAPPEKLMRVSGIGEKIANQIHSLKKEDLDKEFTLAKKYNLKIITQDDRDYPQNLKNIYDPPIVLYIKGQLRERDNLSIAIVGSRRPSFYGLSCAQKFAAELSIWGFTIVSGMARGIDTYAHKGALGNRNRTIAVMGSGFNHIYPPENKELAEDIVRCGAVISEFPCDTKPLRQNFPQRNRLISGLSLGVLIVEAARNSGALITADFALEQGREVFALPGKIDSSTSFGTHELIKQGAKLVANIEDIIEELNPSLSTTKTYFEVRKSGVNINCDGDIALNNELNKINTLNLEVSNPKTKQDSSVIPELTTEESILYNVLSSEPLHLDDIVEKSGMEVSQTLNILLALEMKRLIHQLPGKQFIRNV